ncbi:MAG TPA: hypothetical protein VN600_14895 [Gemmatimonadaceae bacterium]|nr:hypothetical protein [Gemmatimonadaceae bacterium]
MARPFPPRRAFPLAESVVMLRWTTAVAAGCNLMFGAVTARAQMRASGQSLRMDVGVAASTRTDAAVSPDRFDGFGSDLGMTYLVRAKHADLRLAARGGVRALRSLTASGVAQSTERTTQADLTLDAFRAPPSATSRLELGFEARAGGLLIAHRPPDAGSTWFGFATATLGPAFAWSRVSRLGALELTGGAAAIGLVVQPYESLRSVSPPSGARGATVASLQSFQTALHYVPRRIGIGSRVSYEYRAALLRYAGDSPVRELTQALSIALALGGGPPE